MAETYTKLFRSMLLSSVWTEENHTRILWVTLLAESDADGRVYGSVPGIANLAQLSIEETEAALDVLSSPDKYSKTPDSEGRRVIPIDGGFELVNYVKYREKMDAEDRKRKAAERAKRYRDRQKDSSSVTPKRDASVTQCDARDDVRKVRHEDEDEDEELNRDSNSNSHQKSILRAPAKKQSAATPSLACVQFDAFWQAVHLKKGKHAASKAFAKAVERKAKDDDVTQRDASHAIIEAMRAFASSPESTPIDHSPIHPATWLNQGRYDDDQTTWHSNPHSSGKTASNVSFLVDYEKQQNGGRIE